MKAKMTGGSCAVCVVGAHRTSPFTKLGQKKKCQNHNLADENHGGTDENLGLGDKYLVMSPILGVYPPTPLFLRGRWEDDLGGCRDCGSSVSVCHCTVLGSLGPGIHATVLLGHTGVVPQQRAFFFLTGELRGKMSLAWNPKCVVQGAAMIGMYYAGQKSLIIEEEDVGPNFRTFALAALVFVLVYWANALLDNRFGCSHGRFFDSLR